jgi:hypothetical protein
MHLIDRSQPIVSRCGRAFALLIAGVALVASPRAVSASQTKPPKGAIVLFSGKPEELAANWVYEGTDKAPDWKVVGGAIESVKSSIVTKQTFRDFVLHVEFKVPYMPNAHGQERGNSGVGLQDRYEIQVLDSYGISDPGSGDCGAVYSQAAPLTNACKKPLEWQTYDIVFRAPRYNAEGAKVENARVTVWQNDILVQNNQEITGPTGIDDHKPQSEPGPIMLQYHHNSVQFRNVWILPLPPHGALHY